MIAQRYYAGLGRKKDTETIQIFWATDAHFRASVDGDPTAEGASGGRRLFYTAGQKMQHFVDEVNKQKPDLVYFSGDIVEDYFEPDSVDLFMEKWNQIDPTIPKALTIGNHDVAGATSLINTEFAQKVGYGNNPEIAGSKFNQTFEVSRGSNRIKVISVDTNMDESGNHLAITAQRMPPAVIEWVRSELLNATTNKVVIASHGGPSDDSLHFNADDQANFKAMIDDVANQKPNLKMYSFFGHNHVLGVTTRTVLGNNIQSNSLPPVVDELTGKYTIISMSHENVKFQVKDLRYPYP